MWHAWKQPLWDELRSWFSRHWGGRRVQTPINSDPFMQTFPWHLSNNTIFLACAPTCRRKSAPKFVAGWCVISTTVVTGCIRYHIYGKYFEAVLIRNKSKLKKTTINNSVGGPRIQDALCLVPRSSTSFIRSVHGAGQTTIPRGRHDLQVDS